MTKQTPKAGTIGSSALAALPPSVATPAAPDPDVLRAARQRQLTLEAALESALRFGKPLPVEARHAEGLLSIAGALPLVPVLAQGEITHRWEQLVKDILRPGEPRRGVSTLLAARCGALWADLGRAADRTA